MDSTSDVRDHEVELDPELEVLLASQEDLPDIHELTLGEARERMGQLQSLAGSDEAASRVSVDEVALSGLPEASSNARVYRSVNSTPDRSLLFFHGGGWVGGSLDSVDGFCRRFADLLGWPVISATYRLAPEDPFPAALDDVEAVAQELKDEARLPDIDPEGIVIGGASAGGNLAAAACVRRAESGRDPFLGCFLAYPVLDARLDYPSCRRFDRGFILSVETMRWFIDHYLGEQAQGEGDLRDHPHVSPLMSERLDGFDNVLIAAAELDPMRDQSLLFAQRLAAAGCNVTVRLERGLTHGFLGMGSVLPRAERNMGEMAEALRTTMGPAA
jgi:acetyl esterase